MIKSFKIFESKNGKRWFALMTNNENVESVIRLLEDENINVLTYEGTNEYIFLLIHVSNEKMVELKLSKINCGDDIIEKLDVANSKINIEEWLKEYRIKIDIEKYNL